MRTKTLVCAAVLAAGVATSMAQSNVFSLNIVGYANQPVGGGNTLLANPFDKDGTNRADGILPLAPLNGGPTAGTLDSFFIYTWNGGGFDQAFYEDDFTFGNGAGNANGPTNGWANNNNADASTVAVVPPLLPVGKGFFINNAGASNLVTFVGNVVPNPGSTNTVAVLGGGNSLVGSGTPFTVPANDYTGQQIKNLQWNLTPPNGGPQAPGQLDSFFIYTWNGGGYDTVFYEDDFTFGNGAGNANGPTNGWANNNNADATTVAAAPPQIKVAQGFFINNAGLTYTWKQTLTNSP